MCCKNTRKSHFRNRARWRVLCRINIAPAAAVALFVATVSCSGGAPTTSSSTGGTTTAATNAENTSVESTPSAMTLPEFDAALLPARSAPTTLAGLDPPSRAQELVAATTDELGDVGPGWMAVYTELAIPVIDAGGGSQFADDPMGPQWDRVWSFGSLSRGKATIPLADLGTILGADPTTPIDPTILLSDLRAAVVSTDPLVQTFGLFVAGKAKANGGADLLDPSATADQVMLDAATIQLISWVVARDAFQASLVGDPLPMPPSGFARPSSPRRRAETAPCSEALGTADETSWINWVAGKLGGGVGVEGVVSTPGIVEALVTQMKKASQGVDAAKMAGAKAAKFVSRLNVIASVLSLAASVNAVQVNPSMDPDPLIRRPEASDGNTATVSVGLSFSAGALNSNNQALCALSIVANALGVGLSFPADGTALPHVEVIVTSGQNFGTKVYFGAKADPKRVTNDAGLVDIEVQGKARKKAVPKSSPVKHDEFGLKLATQVEELNAQSLINVFIDGLSLGAGAPSGIVDIAKSYHFDLGEYLFKFTDYQTGFKVSVTSNWEFPESSLALSGVFVDAVLDADESGAFAGSALVKWTTGSIGNQCTLVESGPNFSSAVLTGVVDAAGVLTIDVAYDEAVIENTATCGPVTRDSSVTVSPGVVKIIGSSTDDLQDTVSQQLNGVGQSRAGTADFHVVPSGD
jgi:hypothetical protein